MVVRDGGASMIERAVLTYRCGLDAIPLAVIRRSGERIEYLLCEDSPALPFGAEERDRIVKTLIELPVRIASLRHRTMPELFDELEPGSREHFEQMLRDFGLFSTKPVEGEDYQNGGRMRWQIH
jgi:hypothetical protein